MAELLIGAAATAAGAAGTTATAAGVAAGATAATTGFSSTVLSILSGVATAAGVLGTLQGAAAERDTMLMQASATEVESGQGHLSSQNRVTAMKRELLQVLGANRVTAAAAGIDLQGGLPQDQEIRQKQSATREISVEREDDEMRRALLKARASGYRARARDASTAGLFKAFGQVADFGVGVMERG